MVRPRVLGLVVVDLSTLGGHPAFLVVGDGFAAIGWAATIAACLALGTARSQRVAMGAESALEAFTRGDAAATWRSGRPPICWR